MEEIQEDSPQSPEAFGGKEENSGFPVASMNACGRGVKGPEAAWGLQAKSGEAATGEKVEMWVPDRA